ncbi:hypothetical protein N9I93_00180 [Amylibacter sp.]|mgnify:FL=1|nr:hypothetical protein [Amylibacter sp.]
MDIKNLWVVITTINEPTVAIIKYIELSEKFGFKVLIVGDVITPSSYADLNCQFLSLDEQLEMEAKMGLSMPVRHYARKNLGYLHAISQGAAYIFDTDDDNIPYDNFIEFMQTDFQFSSYEQEGHINAYQFFVDQKIWPRGFPLREILASYDAKKPIVSNTDYKRIDSVVQFMADGEPDVDAIYRLVDNRKVYFPRDSRALRLSRTQFCAFNSQATLYPAKAFPLLYLPFTAPFRMTDIWRSFVFQLMRGKFDCDLTFAGAIVWQDRNEHDFLADFEDEILGYLHNEKILALFPDDGKDVSFDVPKIYDKLATMGLVKDDEVKFYRAWEKAIPKL